MFEIIGQVIGIIFLGVFSISFVILVCCWIYTASIEVKIARIKELGELVEYEKKRRS
ncbi:MAG: hypothetical protein HFJ26_01195 [Clostridia bacterium]|nr:hypothetical protein [Clostridia bacterium]